jgi:hypothetical protein
MPPTNTNNKSKKKTYQYLIFSELSDERARTPSCSE